MSDELLNTLLKMIAPQYKQKRFACIFHDKACTDVNTYICPELCTYHLAYRFGLRETAFSFPTPIGNSIPGSWNNLRGICLVAHSVHKDEIVFDKGDVIIPVASYANKAFEAEKQNVQILTIKDDQKESEQRKYLQQLSLARIIHKLNLRTSFQECGDIFKTIYNNILSLVGLTNNDNILEARFKNDCFRLSKQFMRAYREDRQRDACFEIYEKPWNKVDMTTLQEMHAIKPSAVLLTQTYMSMAFCESSEILNECKAHHTQETLIVNRMRDLLRDLHIEAEENHEEFAFSLIKVLLNQYDPYMDPYPFPVFSFNLSARILFTIICCGIPLSVIPNPSTFADKQKMYDYFLHENSIKIDSKLGIQENQFKDCFAFEMNNILPASKKYLVS